MNGMNVSPPALPEAALDRLAAACPDLPPQLKKAATWVLENPASISVSSVREIAEAAQVKPNTLVRMARAIGFEGFEDFREPFRAEVRAGREGYSDRARWLQDLAEGGELDRLFGDMASASMNNVEALFSSTDSASIRAAAKDILAAPATYVLGMGIANPLARNFAYLASMAVDTVSAIPQDGALPVDALAGHLAVPHGTHAGGRALPACGLRGVQRDDVVVNTGVGVVQFDHIIVDVKCEFQRVGAGR